MCIYFHNKWYQSIGDSIYSRFVVGFVAIHQIDLYDVLVTGVIPRSKKSISSDRRQQARVVASSRRFKAGSSVDSEQPASTYQSTGVIHTSGLRRSIYQRTPTSGEKKVRKRKPPFLPCSCEFSRRFYPEIKILHFIHLEYFVFLLGFHNLYQQIQGFISKASLKFELPLLDWDAIVSLWQVKMQVGVYTEEEKHRAPVYQLCIHVSGDTSEVVERELEGSCPEHMEVVKFLMELLRKFAQRPRRLLRRYNYFVLSTRVSCFC